MEDIDSLRDELIRMSKALGQEGRQLALLGEGNTSVDCGDGTFWVKASGSQLGALEVSGVSRVRFTPVLNLLELEAMSEEDVKTGLSGALADPGHNKPSVETFLHALCLSEGGAAWVGHTHPVSANGILCSRLGAKPFLDHIFPDAIVVCGKAPAVVPYVDPGFALAKAVRSELRCYQEVHNQPPKLLLMVNHGLVALGQSATEVENITLMADKWAKILLGTFAIGGPSFLPDDDVTRIDTRLDEHYRRQRLGEA